MSTTFTTEQRHALNAGVQILGKRLEKLSQGALQAGRTKIGEDLLREKTRLERGLPDLIAEPGQATDKQLGDLASALTCYVTNLRAASGTVKGLGKLELADQFTAEADQLEAELTPLLSNQTQLPLAPAGGAQPDLPTTHELAAEAGAEIDRVAAAEKVGVLDALAPPTEAAAEPAEAAGVLSIGQRPRGKKREDFKGLHAAAEGGE